MHLSLQLKLSAPVLALFLFIFSITGMVAHILFQPLLQHVPILYYAVVGILFISTLVVIQYIYLRYYAYRARKAARLAIENGIKPSEVMQKLLPHRLDLHELPPEDPPESDIDLKRIEREMRKKVRRR